MGNEKIVAVSLLITASIATAVFLLSNDIETSDPIQPPTMLMEVDGEVVRGVEGDFCWGNGDREACIDKLDPEKLSTQLVVLSKDVSSTTTYRFYPENYTRPRNLSIEIRDEDGDELSELPYQENMSLPAPSGTFFIVTHAMWPQGNVSHVFQLEIQE